MPKYRYLTPRDGGEGAFAAPSDAAARRRVRRLVRRSWWADEETLQILARLWREDVELSPLRVPVHPEPPACGPWGLWGALLGRVPEDGDLTDAILLKDDPVDEERDERGHLWAAPWLFVGGRPRSRGTWTHAHGAETHRVCIRCGFRSSATSSGRTRSGSSSRSARKRSASPAVDRDPGPGAGRQRRKPCGTC